jgi:hypothetical protein
MKKISKPAIIAFVISFVFIACNNGENKTEPASNDSTATTTTTDATPQNQDMDAEKLLPAFTQLQKILWV